MKIIMLAIIIAIILLIYFGIYRYWGRHHQLVYLDNNGTTYPYSEVVHSVENNSYLGNPSGIYAKDARGVISMFRKMLQNILRAKDYEVIITSTGSESNNLILRGIADKNPGAHFIIGATEHKTSISCCEILRDMGAITFSLAPVNMFGNVERDELEKLIQPNTILVSVMHINNETGNINDIKSIADLCHEYGIYFHCDIVQSFGKIPPNMTELGIDAASITMHKLHGGMGVGALITNIDITPQIAGVQNNHKRGGTENVPAIAGAITCMRIHFADRINKNMHMIHKINYLKSLLQPSIPFSQFYDKPDNYEPKLDKRYFCYLSNDDSINTLLFSIVGEQKYCNIKLRQKLYENGFIVSIGSTCNTNEKGASHVLKAMKAPHVIRCGVLRVSICDDTKHSELKRFAEELMKLTECCHLPIA